MHSATTDASFNIKDYIEILFRRRGLIIVFFLTTVIVVIIGTFTMKPVYQAAVTLLIDVESPNVLTTSGMVSLDQFSYYSYKEYYQSQKELIVSRSIIRTAFEEIELINSKEYKSAKDPIGKFLKTIKAEAVPDTRLLILKVNNRDPHLAAKIANRIAELYVRRNLYYITKGELTNLLKNEYLKMETRLSEESKIYKLKHPRIVRLKKEMADVAKKIEQTQKWAFNLDASAPEIGDDYVRLLEGFKANNVSVQDPAEVPLVPVKPKKILNLILAVFVGFFGSIGFVFFAEYLDDTIRDAKDVAAVVDWPFLGNIFKIGEDKEHADMKKELLVHLKPKDIAAEAYRAIRTAVAFSSTEEHPTKTIVITSPGPEEGKTITLCNLGIAMAQNNKKVLLIDSDMRKPRLHYLFNVKNDKGLSSVLSGQSELKDVIQKSEIENISLVTSGPYAPNPSELLSSSKIEEIIKTARNEFDFILFDTPPIIIVTDAAILSRAVDGIIIVLESEGTSKKILPQVDRIIKDTRMRLLGVIINKISAHSGSYYNYSYYSTP